MGSCKQLFTPEGSKNLDLALEDALATARELGLPVQRAGRCASTKVVRCCHHGHYGPGGIAGRSPEGNE